MTETNEQCKNAAAKVMAVKESLVTIEVDEGALRKNEVGYIIVGKERLKSEVLRIHGRCRRHAGV